MQNKVSKMRKHEDWKMGIINKSGYNNLSLMCCGS